MNRFYLLVAVSLFCLAPARANEVLIAPQSVGSYTVAFGTPLNPEDTMLVSNVSGFVSRSYMVFDATEIDKLVFSLELRSHSGGGFGRRHDLNIAFHPFTGDASKLTDGTIDFDDLTDTKSYAELFSPGITPNDTEFTVGLSSAAVADFNRSTGTFVITVTQPVESPTSGFMGGVTASEVSLVAVTAVPEPSCLALLSCVAMLATVRRRIR